MRAARRWPLALAGLVLAALALRLWGVTHGLPYVFNADENAHFVPRAIGMFGHSLNPQYFVNPPAFTYLLHVAFFARWGGREAIGDAFAADPGAAFTIARVLAAILGAAAAGLLAWAGARLAGRRVGRDRGRAARGRVPAGALRAPRRQRRAGAGAAVPEPGRRGGGLPVRAADATTRSPGRRSASHARRSTPPGSCCCAWSPPPSWGLGGRGAGSRSRARSRSSASSSPTRTRCSTGRRSATACRSSPRRPATAAASSGCWETAGSCTTWGR